MAVLGGCGLSLREGYRAIRLSSEGAYILFWAYLALAAGYYAIIRVLASSKAREWTANEESLGGGTSLTRE